MPGNRRIVPEARLTRNSPSDPIRPRSLFSLAGAVPRRLICNGESLRDP